MGWWPFGKKSQPTKRIDDPLRKDTRQWLSELRDVCEMNFDNPEGARREIRQMQVNWHQALLEGILQNTTEKALKVGPIAYLPAQMMNGWNGWTMRSFGNQAGDLTKTLTRIEEGLPLESTWQKPRCTCCKPVHSRGRSVGSIEHLGLEVDEVQVNAMRTKKNSRLQMDGIKSCLHRQ